MSLVFSSLARKCKIVHNRRCSDLRSQFTQTNRSHLCELYIIYKTRRTIMSAPKYRVKRVAGHDASPTGQDKRQKSTQPAIIPTFAFTAKGQGGMIPKIGFGSATIYGTDCERAVTYALEAGYRYIDTALLYKNHTPVGNALNKSKVPRSEIFLTSKCSFFCAEDAFPNTPETSMNLKGRELESIDICLKELQQDYIDLMLIHNPCTSKEELSAAMMPHYFELESLKTPNAAPPVRYFSDDLYLFWSTSTVSYFCRHSKCREK